VKIFENVFKIDVKKNLDKRGFFIEIFRIDQLNFRSKILQVSHSFTKKNILKGWHFHKKQTQWNYLLEGKIKVFLIDNRKKSKTYKKIKSFIIDSKKNKSVYFFPANIGHAYIALSQKNHMIYGTSGNYKTKEEYKLPFNKSLLK
jgi:dTDP-4-dehydrorhamnose 3,5-epimerase